MKYVIGLTGNIATGKSSVLRILKQLGAATLDADAITRQVMEPGEPAYAEIVAAFGAGLLDQRGQIERAALGRLVFSDPTALRRLEEIVHPPTISRIKKMIEEVPPGVIVIEAIKLIESGTADELCDAVWVVHAPAEQQLRRLVRDRDMSEGDARQRIVAQGPQEEKLARADVLIDNSGSRGETRRQVLAAWSRIPAAYRGSARPETD